MFIHFLLHLSNIEVIYYSYFHTTEVLIKQLITLKLNLKTSDAIKINEKFKFDDSLFIKFMTKLTINI